MNRISVAAAALAGLMLVGCGGGDDPAPAPPTGGTPTPTPPAAPAPVDFNVYTVQLVGQQGTSSDRADPVSTDDITFRFDNEETTASVYASALPP